MILLLFGLGYSLRPELRLDPSRRSGARSLPLGYDRMGLDSLLGSGQCKRAYIVIPALRRNLLDGRINAYQETSDTLIFR